MTDKSTSVLLISQDEKIHTAFDNALSEDSYTLSAEHKALVDLNGKRANIAAHHDIVLFDLDQNNPESLLAAREMNAARAAGTILIALADNDLPLSKARELNRAGVDDVLPRHALDDEIIPQIEAWRARQSAQLPALWAGQATEGKVIAVAQARGGVGSSTLAVNLADVLQLRRGVFSKKATCKVALVDLDFQFGSIAALVDVEETDALWRMAMEGTVPDAAFVEQALTVSESGLSVLTAPSRFGPLNALKSEQVGAILDVLKKSHDYVVVDMPGALVDWIDPVLSRADKMLLVTDITVPSVRSARKLIDFYHAEHPGLEIEFVASYEKKPIMYSSRHRAAAELLENQISFWIPNDPKAMREAVDRGRPLVNIAPRSNIAKAFRRIGHEISAALPPRIVSPQ